MKILHLNSELTWRGGERQLFFLHEGLISRGISSIILGKNESQLHKKCKERALPFESFPFSGSFNLSSAWRLKSHCESKGIDLIHIHTSKAHTLAVLAAVLGLKIPMILSRRVDFPLKSNLLSRFKYGHKNIKKILCVSEKIAGIVNSGISKPSRVEVVYSGIDLSVKDPIQVFDLRKAHNIPANRKLVGNTSAIADHKDYPTFVETAALLLKKRDDLHFIVVGDGPLRIRLKNLIEEMDLGKYFTLTGYVENPTEYLVHFDVFLFTSKTEGLGTSVLDAMLHEIPIVSTNAGGIPEMIRQEENGLVSAVGDAPSLAQNVLRVLDDPELKSSIILKATETVKSFDKEIMIDRTIKAYKRVLTNS